MNDKATEMRHTTAYDYDAIWDSLFDYECKCGHFEALPGHIEVERHKCAHCGRVGNWIELAEL